MRRKLLALVVLSLVGTLLWIYTSATWIIWDGSFDLTVHVSSNPGPSRSVVCQAFGRREHAEYVRENLLPPETRLWTATANPIEGKPLVVTVPISGREAMSGRKLSRYQFRYLVVTAELPDARRVSKLVEIPDSRESKEIHVELP